MITIYIILNNIYDKKNNIDQLLIIIVIFIWFFIKILIR